MGGLRQPVRIGMSRSDSRRDQEGDKCYRKSGIEPRNDPHPLAQKEMGKASNSHESHGDEYTNASENDEERKGDWAIYASGVRTFIPPQIRLR